VRLLAGEGLFFRPKAGRTPNGYRDRGDGPQPADVAAYYTWHWGNIVDIETLAWVCAEAILLVTPPIAAIGRSVVTRSFPHLLGRLVKLYCIIVCLFLISTFTKVTFISFFANFAYIGITYMAYCSLISLSLIIKPFMIRYFIYLVGIIPIILGYIVATIGIIPFAWIVMDYARPSESHAMEEGLICRVRSWGSVPAGDWYAFELYRRHGAIPFLERKLFGYSVPIESTFDSTPGGPASCLGALDAYQAKIKGESREP
jgi:hypothetical protein